MTVDRLPDSPAGRPLAVGIGATQGAVGEVQDLDEPEVGYQAIARLSGHLAAMWRTVYPHVDGHVGTDGQLRSVCLDRAREVEWALRLRRSRLRRTAARPRLGIHPLRPFGSGSVTTRAPVWTWLGDRP